MTLRIDVNVPPRLIDRAREQQSERRLAKASEQRQAVVRKEALRQVVQQRLAKGLNATGQQETGGAMEDQRRKWFGAQATTKNIQIGVARVKYVNYMENSVYSILTRSGLLIAGSATNGLDVVLLPVAGDVFVLSTKTFPDDEPAYNAYICSNNSSRSIPTPDTVNNIHVTVVNGEFATARSWGVQGWNNLSMYGGISYGAGIYYAINRIPRHEWDVVPDSAIVYSSNPPTNDWHFERVIYPHYTRQRDGYNGLPRALYPQEAENDDFLIPEAEYLDQSSSYWKSINAKPLNDMRDGLAEGGLFPMTPGSVHVIRTDNVILCWDWGRPDFCREQLLSLGFSPEDLIP